MTTTIDTNHPLLNTNAERLRIEAMLRHLGSGADLRDLPASASEKVALVKTANQRGLIAWHKSRGRYELTAAGWCQLAPTRRFGVGSIMVGTTLGATLGAVALAVFWLTAGAAHMSAPAVKSATAPAPAPVQVAKLSAPAVEGAASGPALVESASAPDESTTASAAPPASVPASAPPREAVPAPAPVEAVPTKVAEEPTPEQLAESAKAKHVAAKKARQRAAARRRREDAARAWAAGESRTREAEYSGHGVYSSYGGYGGYGGQNSWFAYR